MHKSRTTLEQSIKILEGSNLLRVPTSHLVTHFEFYFKTSCKFKIVVISVLIRLNRFFVFNMILSDYFDINLMLTMQPNYSNHSKIGMGLKARNLSLKRAGCFALFVFLVSRDE